MDLKVAGKDGAKTIPAEQMATFAHYIQQAQFRFIVTKVVGSHELSITHRASGKRVCGLSHNSLIAARGDYKVAAVSELEAFINAKGAARVASVLRAAEV